MVALIDAGCSNEASEGGGNERATERSKAMKFAECMRGNGVGDFPDPPASGESTIDGVLNGSSLDPSPPAWKTAIATCEDLQPPGFTGDGERSAEEQDASLEFARCIRDNGLTDFPDPVNGEPLVDTHRIPSAATSNGMSILNAAMQTCRDHVRAAVLVAASITGGLVVVSDAKRATPAAQAPPASTVEVERGPLSAMVSLNVEPRAELRRLRRLRHRPRLAQYSVPETGSRFGSC